MHGEQRATKKPEIFGPVGENCQILEMLQKMYGDNTMLCTRGSKRDTRR